MTIRIASLFLIALITTSVAHAQDDGDGGDDMLEEIEVRAQKSTSQLQKVVLKARLDFWDMYNSLNTIDDYRVVCDRTAVTGSRFKRERCVPKYFSDKMAEMTQQQSLRRGADGSIQLVGPPPSERNVILETKDKKRAADRHMIKLIEKHPGLREKYDTLLDANRALERSKMREGEAE